MEFWRMAVVRKMGRDLYISVTVLRMERNIYCYLLALHQP